jgi:hypothetical protein
MDEPGTEIEAPLQLRRAQRTIELLRPWLLFVVYVIAATRGWWFIAKLAQIWTPVISSFAFHHLHHAFPKVPTALLPLMAKRAGVAEYHAHVHR